MIESGQISKRMPLAYSALFLVVAGPIAAYGILSSRENHIIRPEDPSRRDHPGRDPSPSACADHETGAVWCGEECVRTSESVLHCGACGLRCSEGLECITGRCVPPSDVQAQARARRAHFDQFSGGTGSYGTWSSLGPRRGGRLDGIVANDSDASDLTVAAPGGGVWRTEDNGSNWSLTGTYGLADFTAWKLERDRISSSRLFLVTPMTVYATIDAGSTWSNIGGYTMPSRLLPSDSARFVSDPAPFAQMVFDGSTRLLLWGLTCEGLHYSTNGTSFTQIWPFTGGSSELNNCINAIAVDEGTKRVFISTMSSTSNSAPPNVYRSNCAWTSSGPCCTTPGSCWDLITTGLSDGPITSEIAYTGYSNWVATAVGQSGSSLVHNGSGNPTTWANASAFPPDGGWAGATWDPRPFLYMGGGTNHFVVGNAGAYSSTNLGASWSELIVSGMHADIRAAYFSSSLGRLWLTTDGAFSDGTGGNIVRWNASAGGTPTSATTIPVSGSNGLPVWQPYFTAVIPRSSGTPRLIIGLQDNAGACSDDGSSWNGWGPNGDTYAFAQTSTSTDVVGYAIGNGQTLVKYSNLATASSCFAITSRSATIGNTGNFWQRSLIAIHPTDADRVYMASNARVIRVTFPDSGTITPTNGADISTSGTNRTITTLAVDSSGNLYAGTLNGGAFVSTDEGDSWTAWGPSWSTAPRQVLRIVHSSYGGGTVWLASTSGLYRKVGSGSWTLVHGGSGYTVTDIAVDPSCPQRIYAALGYASLTAYHRGGINITNDNGDNWYSTTSGLELHQAPIADIEVQPDNNRYVYAAVFGQGVWRLDRGSSPSCP